MKRIFFHCGLPKTGTTSIQNFFAAESALLSKQLCYPLPNAQDGNAGWMVQHILAGNIQYIVERIARRYSSNRITVFSSENLYHAIRINSDAFVELISLLECNVICYVPAPVDFINGTLKQLVSKHCHSSFSVDERIAEITDYSLAINALRDSIEPDKLIIKPFDRSALACNSVVVDILQLLGVSDEKVRIRARSYNYRNASKSPLELGILAHLAFCGMTLLPPETQNNIRSSLEHFSLISGDRFQSQARSVKWTKSDMKLINYLEDSYGNIFGKHPPESKALNYIAPDDKVLEEFFLFVRDHDDTLCSVLERMPCYFDVSRASLVQGVGTSTNAFNASVMHRSDLRKHWMSRGHSVNHKGHLAFSASTDNVYIDLPLIYPIKNAIPWVKITPDPALTATPRLYWTNERHLAISRNHSVPFSPIDQTDQIAFVKDALFNGTLAIIIEGVCKECSIYDIEIGFDMGLSG